MSRGRDRRPGGRASTYQLVNAVDGTVVLVTQPLHALKAETAGEGAGYGHPHTARPHRSPGFSPGEGGFRANAQPRTMRPRPSSQAAVTPRGIDCDGERGLAGRYKP